MCAVRIGQDIKSRNYGRWPASLEEWQEVTHRYGLALYIVEGISSPALTLDNVIFVRSCRRLSTLARRICHEVAEHVAQREGGISPYQFTSTANEFHRVARIVEVQE